MEQDSHEVNQLKAGLQRVQDSVKGAPEKMLMVLAVIAEGVIMLLKNQEVQNDGREAQSGQCRGPSDGGLSDRKGTQHRNDKSNSSSKSRR